MFNRDYIKEQIKKRKGKCGGHGCCDVTLLEKVVNINIRKCYDDKNKKCLRWDNIPFSCLSYPFDEKDKHPMLRDICKFKWEEK